MPRLRKEDAQRIRYPHVIRWLVLQAGRLCPLPYREGPISVDDVPACL
jgi:hypothetical protein